MEVRFAAVVLATLLISPHSYSQDLLFLAPALLLLSTQSRTGPAWTLASLAVWLTLRVHFSVLAATGVGPGNLLLAGLFAALVRAEPIGPRLGRTGLTLTEHDQDEKRRTPWLVWPANLILFVGLASVLVFTSSMKNSGFTVGYYPAPPVSRVDLQPAAAIPTSAPPGATESPPAADEQTPIPSSGPDSGRGEGDQEAPP
jgi:hypothetical protein